MTVGPLCQDHLPPSNDTEEREENACEEVAPLQDQVSLPIERRRWQDAIDAVNLTPRCSREGKCQPVPGSSPNPI